MFYVVVVVAEHLTQLWPLLLFALTSIAVCHLAAKKCTAICPITAKKTTDRTVGRSTTAQLDHYQQDSRLIDGSNVEQYSSLALRRSSSFEFTHPPITVINTSTGECSSTFMRFFSENGNTLLYGSCFSVYLCTCFFNLSGLLLKGWSARSLETLHF